MSVAAADEGGRIRGRIVDPTGASLPAHIRLVPLDPKSPWIRSDTNQQGEFLIEDVPAGNYRVDAWFPGFRANHVSDVLIAEGHVTIVDDIELSLIGCDYPGVSCDPISTTEPEPDPHPIVARGALTLRLASGANLDRIWPADVGSKKKADLFFNQRDAELYLSPGEGSQLSMLNPPTADCTDVHYGNTSERIDGLGPGYDLCVRTKTGRFAHVLIVGDVPASSLELKIWLVTRR